MTNKLLRTDRLEGLSDGVIAVVITLMFMGFEHSYQQIRDARSSQEILAYLVAERSRFLSYCLSFLFIGGYWLKHHIIFHYVCRADRIFLGLNLLFLMCIAFIPIATDWLVESEHHEFNAILVIYGLSHTISSLALLSVWSWATYKRRLVIADIEVDTIRAIRQQIIGAIVATLSGIAASFISIHLGLIVLIVTAFSILWPRSSDGHWMRADTSRGSDKSPATASAGWGQELSPLRGGSGGLATTTK